MDDFERFIEHEKVRAAKAAIVVASDPLVFAYTKNFDHLGFAEKENFINHFSTVCSSALKTGIVGFHKIREAPTVRETESGNVKFFTAGLHQRLMLHGRLSGSAIKVNVHPEILAHLSLGEIIKTPPHELMHVYQALCIDRPKILPLEFRINIPPIFEHNWSNYIEPTDRAGYRGQALEMHAFAGEEAFAKSFMDFMAGKELLRAPETFDCAVVEKEMKSGRILMPNEGPQSVNPYRHYYSGEIAEREIGEVIGADPERAKWAFATPMEFFAKAAACGEYLFPHDPLPALRKLYTYAENAMDDPQLQVPVDIQARARRRLESFKNSKRIEVRSPVENMLKRLDRYGPLPPPAKIDAKGRPHSLS